MKIIDINTGQDITPAPPTLQDEFMEDLIQLIQTKPVDTYRFELSFSIFLFCIC